MNNVEQVRTGAARIVGPLLECVPQGESVTAVDYVRAGWTLVPIARGAKGPKGLAALEWNIRERCVTTEERAATLAGGNVGLAHSYSGTCAVDFDDLEHATEWLAGHGIDAHALLNAPDAVRISSGRPGRAKLLYRLPTPLLSLSLVPFTDASGKQHDALELRCADKQGLTKQDVLPPSIHPKTGMPYTWEYGDDLIGHWSAPPLLPKALRELWEKLAAPAVESEAAVARAQDGPVDMERIRKILFQQDPSADEEDWHHCLMAVHWETRGSREGLDLADEWSKGGSNYTGRAPIASRWRSWKLDIANPITLASLRVEVPATADDLDVIDVVQSVIGEVPRALHLCSDQANAHRIMRHYEGRLMSSAGGRFYAWVGTHWRFDDGEARRYACNLSEIVRAEAETARKKADRAFAALDPELVKAAAEQPRKAALGKTETGAKAMELLETAEALEKWSAACEAKRVQDAALGLLRELIRVDEKHLDADPWALNCESGTIDLRTGEMRAHNPKDFITKLAPVRFDPNATAPRFEGFLA